MRRIIRIGVMLLACAGALGLAAPGAAEEAAPAYTRAVLVQGAPLGSTNGILCDAQDNLLIVSVRGRYLKVMDTTTGAVLATYGPEMGVDSPDDVAIGPDGALYVTNILNGTVTRITPDGTHDTVADLGMGVNAVRASPDGSKLYVSKAILGDALYEIDLTGTAEPRLIAEHIGSPNSMSFGPDGRLYGVLNHYGEIIRWDLEAGTYETVADGFEFPTAVKADGAGNLFTVEYLRGEVIRIDAQSGERTVMARLYGGLDNLAIDSTGRLFVSSNGNGGIAEVLPDGGLRAVSSPGMLAPSGVAVLPGDGGDRVFVADFTNIREIDRTSGDQKAVAISSFPPQGEPHPGKEFTENKSGIATIMPAFSLAPDGDKLIATSYFGNVVHIFDPAVNASVRVYTHFKVPINAIRFQGDLVVAELGTQSVVRQAEGQDAQTTLATGLQLPTGLAATDDDLWAADWSTGRVLQLIKDGKLLAEPTEVAAGLQNPEGMAVAPDGGLLVVEVGADRLVRIDPATGAVSTVMENLGTGGPSLPGLPPSANLSSVAVGSDGTIYVTADKTIQIITLTPQ